MTDPRKIAVISGGMGGVGRATAVALARENYRVVVLHRNSSGDEIAEAQSSMPGEHVFMKCDVCNTKETAHVIETISHAGNIGVAVHSAVDPISRERILGMDEITFRGQFEAGFFGAFNFFQPIAKVMKEQKQGTLIGITSTVIESDSTPARMGAYTVGKIALRGLLRELHRESQSSGVRVFAVAPGLMRTQLNKDLPEKYFEMAMEHPMATEDVARAIVTLCSDPKIASGSSYLVSSGKHTPL